MFKNYQEAGLDSENLSLETKNSFKNYKDAQKSFASM